MAGKYAGETVFFPRISLISNGDDLSVDWKRLKFPVKLSYAMNTTNHRARALKLLASK